MLNCCELTGQIIRSPIYRKSPSGIEHCQFHLVHQSEQIEAGLKRKARCHIRILVTGNERLTQNLQKGCYVKVVGFLNQHIARNGEEHFYLHASQIEIIG